MKTSWLFVLDGWVENIFEKKEEKSLYLEFYHCDETNREFANDMKWFFFCKWQKSFLTVFSPLNFTLNRKKEGKKLMGLTDLLF